MLSKARRATARRAGKAGGGGARKAVQAGGPTMHALRGGTRRGDGARCAQSVAEAGRSCKPQGAWSRRPLLLRGGPGQVVAARPAGSSLLAHCGPHARVDEAPGRGLQQGGGAGRVIWARPATPPPFPGRSQVTLPKGATRHCTPNAATIFPLAAALLGLPARWAAAGKAWPAAAASLSWGCNGPAHAGSQSGPSPG